MLKWKHHIPETTTSFSYFWHSLLSNGIELHLPSPNHSENTVPQWYLSTQLDGRYVIVGAYVVPSMNELLTILFSPSDKFSCYFMIIISCNSSYWKCSRLQMNPIISYTKGPLFFWLVLFRQSYNFYSLSEPFNRLDILRRGFLTKTLDKISNDWSRRQHNKS